jgi:phage terminase large subunit-like protein
VSFFARLHGQAGSGELPNAASFHATTSEMNPHVTGEFLAQQLAALGELEFAREFLAEFGAGGLNFIEQSALRACVGDFREVLPSDGRGWTIGADMSFSTDPAAWVAAAHSSTDGGSLIVGHADRRVHGSRKRRVRRSRDEETARIEAVVADVCEVARRYQVSRVIVDQHLPGVVVDEFSKHGVYAVVRPWTAASLTMAAQSLRARVDSGRIEICDVPQLISEIGRLRTRYRAGSAVVEVPRSGDGHCDMAVALLAAIGELDQSSGADTAAFFRRRRDWVRDNDDGQFSKGAMTRVY